MQREEGTLVRDNPEANRYLVTGQVRQGGANRQGESGTTSARNSFEPPGMGGKRRRAVAAGGQERRTVGQSLRDRERGGG